MGDIRRIVAESSRVLADQGHGDLIWGHSSARDDEGRGAWIKASSWGLDEVDAARVHLVAPDGRVLEGDGARHGEYPIHTAILAARPDVGGVVHTHSPYAVALAASGQPLLPVSHAGSMFVPPDVPRFTRTSGLITTPELGAEVAVALGGARAMFLVNHGIVTVGPTLQLATVVAVVLERACRQQYLTTAFGGRPTWTRPDEAVAKRDHFGDGVLTAAWDYMVRTLPPVRRGTSAAKEIAG